MGESIPEFEDLSHVYGSDGLEDVKERYVRLAAGFHAAFGHSPQIFARSPGRVNLIGEHIDYEGFAVFPMAIRQDTVVAIRITEGSALTITNVNPEKYPQQSFKADPSQAVNIDEHTWANYFLAAYKGVFEYLESKSLSPTLTGLQVLVDGRVPTGSGLSSSSAFVCACSLAVLGVYGISAPKNDVAEFTCTCEHHVGMQSGGMDQAISIMAKSGVAKLIEFNPVKGTDVPLPTGATFVVANSLAVSNKAETANLRYNVRVVECQMASMLLAQSLGVDVVDEYRTLKQIESLFEERGITDPLAYAGKHLQKEPYTESEVAKLLGKPLQEVFAGSPSTLRVLAKANALKGFYLHDRVFHVFGEAQRVHDFKSVCESDTKMDEKLTKLGNLMTASHSSCRDLYDCSCPELEELVALAAANGALGARLTGAGWGGCAVFLLQDEDAEQFVGHIIMKYFEKRIQNGTISKEEISECIFASKPSSGGAILKLSL